MQSIDRYVSTRLNTRQPGLLKNSRKEEIRSKYLVLRLGKEGSRSNLNEFANQVR